MLGFGVALLAAFVVAALGAPLVERLYAALLAPIMTVKMAEPGEDRGGDTDGAKSEEAERKRPRERWALSGIVTLLFTYIVTGVAFAVSGGTAGYVVAWAAFENEAKGPTSVTSGAGSVVNDATDAMKGAARAANGAVTAVEWGFLIGVLFAGMARIRAVVALQALADTLCSLAVLTLGAATFWFVATFVNHPEWLKLFSFAWLRDHLFKGPPAAVFTSLAAVVCVEAIVYLREGFRLADASTISLAGLRQRAEQHERVEQIFWPGRVESRTNEVIRDAIDTDGIRSICWMTQTAPVSHCDAIMGAATRWARDRCARKEDATDLARRLIETNLRVIVPSEDMLKVVQERIPWLKRWRIMPKPLPGFSTFRTRILTLNGRVAIMHLPIPYTGLVSEQSNCAGITRSPQCIRELQSMFDSIWEWGHEDYVQGEVAKAMTAGDEQECLTLLAISENEHGIGFVELLHNLQKRGSTLTPHALEDVVLRLHKRNLITCDGKRDRYYARRRCHSCSVLDFLTRLVYPEIVTPPPVGESTDQNEIGPSS